jgi:nicotinate-nucleotide adenylyltransferase
MKTGLFFGSFNPIHNGHLAIAQHILNESELDLIIFVVSPYNPLKHGKDMIEAKKRLEMVRLSTADNPRFEVSDIEFGLEIPSYTYNTLRAFTKKHPDSEITLVMGSDILEQLPQWKNVEEILAYPILVYQRPNHHHNPYPDHKNIKILKAHLLNISASSIRKMLEENKDIKYLVRDEIISLLKFD